MIAYDYAGTGAALPPRPGLRPAAPRLLLDGVLHPRRTSPIVALSGLLPRGRGTLAPIRALLDAVAAESGFAEQWPHRPRPWVVAVDHSTGRRVVFGRDDFAARRGGTVRRGGAVRQGGAARQGSAVRVVRRAPLAAAVVASCSIPGWYAPTVIDGVPYVDGGVASNASADVLLGTAVDEVFVLAPMGGTGRPRPRTVLERIDRGVRRAISRTIVRDATALRAQGIRVHVLTPGPADLAAMGVNLMDSRTRGDVLDAARTSVAERLRRALPARSAIEEAGA